MFVWILDTNVEGKPYNEETKTILKYVTCETKSFYILPLFYFFFIITIALLIDVSIYCHLIKHKAKERHLLPFYITNNELKKFCINNIKMKSKDKLKEIDTKNPMYYWFDYIMRVRDIDYDFLLDEKSYKNNYDI